MASRNRRTPSSSTRRSRAIVVHSPFDRNALIHYGVLAGFVASGLIEWPVAFVIGMGYVLMRSRNAEIRAVGEAARDL